MSRMTATERRPLYVVRGNPAKRKDRQSPGAQSAPELRQDLSIIRPDDNSASTWRSSRGYWIVPPSFAARPTAAGAGLAAVVLPDALVGWSCAAVGVARVPPSFVPRADGSAAGAVEVAGCDCDAEGGGEYRAPPSLAALCAKAGAAESARVSAAMATGARRLCLFMVSSKRGRLQLDTQGAGANASGAWWHGAPAVLRFIGLTPLIPRANT